MCFDAQSKHYESFSDRLLTFKNWPGVQTPYSLASAGFFHIQGGDDVQCFYCGIRIHQWKPSDNALGEHLRWSRDCLYAKLMKTKSVEKCVEVKANVQSKRYHYAVMLAMIGSFLDPFVALMLAVYIVVFM